MSVVQRVIILVWVVGILLMGLFPPWSAAGYYAVWRPPIIISPMDGGVWSPRQIDSVRLGFQLLVSTLATAGLVIALHRVQLDLAQLRMVGMVLLVTSAALALALSVAFLLGWW